MRYKISVDTGGTFTDVVVQDDRGRVVIGILTDMFGWHLALGAMGALGLLAALGFVILLPASRNFVRRPGFQLSYHVRAWEGHLRHPGLPFVFLIGAFAMGCFVTVYNYAGFRLSAAPYDLSQGQISLIFVVYLCGMVTSSIAGAMSDRIGRGPVLLCRRTPCATQGMTTDMAMPP